MVSLCRTWKTGNVVSGHQPDRTAGPYRDRHGVTAVVDLSPVIAKGYSFAPMEDPAYFVGRMRIVMDRPGLERPDHVDFSAGGLRFRTFPEEAETEFGASETQPVAETITCQTR